MDEGYVDPQLGVLETESVGFSGTPKDMGPNKGPILFPNPTPICESLKIWVHGMGIVWVQLTSLGGPMSL